MKIRNIRVGSVIGASGINNFYGDGYPYHNILRIALLFTPFWVPLFRLLKIFLRPTLPPPPEQEGPRSIFMQLVMVSDGIPLYPVWFSFNGIIHTTKTITASERKGNLKTGPDRMTPTEFHPKCIYVDMEKQVAINNVALTGPGIEAILKSGELQSIEGPFFISIMPVGATPEERLQEIRFIGGTLDVFRQKHPFKGKPIIQLNISCPNTGHETEDYVKEVEQWEYHLRGIGMPITAKLNSLTPYEVAKGLSKIFDAFFVTNTIPYPLLTDLEKKDYFYCMEQSPLMKYQDEFNVKGAGGASGKVLLERALRYVEGLRAHGIRIPIILGGGILEPEHVDMAKAAGADGISPGSITMIAPWNLPKVIRRAHEIFD
jgi:dihydroorotate dehydrogenase